MQRALRLGTHGAPASLTIVRTRPPVPHAPRSGGGESLAKRLALVVHEQEPPSSLICEPQKPRKHGDLLPLPTEGRYRGAADER